MALTRRRSDTYTGGSILFCSSSLKSASSPSTSSGTETACCAFSLQPNINVLTVRRKVFCQKQALCRVGGQGLAYDIERCYLQRVNSPSKLYLMVVKSSCVTSVLPLFAGDVGSPADRAALAVSAVRSSAFRFAADTCFTSRRTCIKNDVLKSNEAESCTLQQVATYNMLLVRYGF
jgi:hypothetical protein